MKKTPPTDWKLLKYSLATAMLALIIFIAFIPGQGEFVQLFLPYSLLFFIYVWVCLNVSGLKLVKYFLMLGLLMRFVLVFSFPNLSDDIYRFIWDGQMLVHGLNPFAYLPSDVIETFGSVGLADASLFAKLNSPDYYSVYPPIAQAVFALSAYLFPSSILGQTMLIKLVLFACELGSILIMFRLLKKFMLPANRVLWYALNPLVIIEICGNTHFEGAMVFFLLLAIYLTFQSKYTVSALAMTASVASKLLSLILAPLMLWQVGLRRWWYWSIAGLSTLFAFLPMLLSVNESAGFLDSLRLYFQTFEFNASLYYVARWIGFKLTGYNMIATIGPILAVVSFSSIIAISIIHRSKDWKEFFTPALWCFTIYLLCTTTVHPWYLCLPLALTVFSRFRYPVVWSWLIFLTYINYSYEEYTVNYYLIALEYFIVLSYAFFEFAKVKNH